MKIHTRHTYIHSGLFILFTLLASGCTGVDKREMAAAVNIGEKYSPPAATAPLHSGHATKEEQKTANRSGWWTLYNNKELNALMTSAFKDNPTIGQTRARLDQAAAQARRSASDFWPDLAVTGTRGDTRGDNRTPSDFSLAAAAGYELDLWGKNRAAFEADNLEAEAAAQNLRTAAITLSASITESWLRLLAAREEETLVRKQIETNETILKLQYKRFENGSADALDVLQQKETLARSKAQLPDILAQQDLLEHQISVLTGQSSVSRPQISDNTLPPPAPLPESGVPSELLANRPEISAAWLSLRSADWAAQAAWRDRLPNFTLSATYSTTATALDSLFNTWILDMAVQAAMPLIDGGERRAETLRRRAVADERFHAYREAVLTAVAEVEDALSLNYHQAREIEALEAQREATNNTLKQAQISYANGDQDYINVLNSLINRQTLERQIIEEHLNLHLNRVKLYRALGGHLWTEEII